MESRELGRIYARPLRDTPWTTPHTPHHHHRRFADPIRLLSVGTWTEKALEASCGSIRLDARQTGGSLRPSSVSGTSQAPRVSPSDRESTFRIFGSTSIVEWSHRRRDQGIAGRMRRDGDEQEQG